MKPLIFEAAGFLSKADNIANWKRSIGDRREQSLDLGGPEHTSIDDLWISLGDLLEMILSWSLSHSQIQDT